MGTTPPLGNMSYSFGFKKNLGKKWGKAPLPRN